MCVLHAPADKIRLPPPHDALARCANSTPRNEAAPGLRPADANEATGSTVSDCSFRASLSLSLSPHRQTHSTHAHIYGYSYSSRARGGFSQHTLGGIRRGRLTFNQRKVHSPLQGSDIHLISHARRSRLPRPPTMPPTPPPTPASPASHARKKRPHTSSESSLDFSVLFSTGGDTDLGSVVRS